MRERPSDDSSDELGLDDPSGSHNAAQAMMQCMMAMVGMMGNQGWK